MTTQANIPNKWYVPFANGDSARVELPVTTADPTRASQTLGFPPLTMQPPESGGVPPQGEDFNGGMNQIARVAWWVLNGGGWPYDSTFANNASINGYPNGATLQSADFRGDWISTSDGNTNNPDTNGTNWVPGFQYGVTALTSLTGGTVTPTPAQAAKGTITLAGTLSSALTIILPTWLKNWTITNNTTGAFVTIVKTAAGSGVTIPQNGAPTRVTGDGTNIVQAAENVALATQTTNPLQAIQSPAYSSRGLTGTNNATTPNTKFDVSADVVTVWSAVSGAVRSIVSPGTITNDFGLAGPAVNGRDQAGAFSASSWVHLYYVWNGSTLATVSSTVAPPTGPTLTGALAGYTSWCYIGAVRFNGSSQIVPMFIRGARHYYVSLQVALNGGAATTSTAVNVATLVPPNASNYVVTIRTMGGATGTGPTLSFSHFLEITSGSTFHESDFLITGSASTGQSQAAPGPAVDVPNVSQAYRYYLSTVVGSGVNATHQINQYVVPNGGA